MAFSGKVVIVTGAASGIGAAAAKLFAQDGARVALVDLNGTKLAATERQCQARGAKTLAITADLTNEQETDAVVEKTIDKFQQVDVLVNCAGFLKPGSLLEGNILEAYDVVMRINVRAAIHLSSLAAPHLAKTKGNIINISSVASFVVPKSPQLAPYHISKAALDHFTRMAAMELAPSGVRVNSINPGIVKTDFLAHAGTPISQDLHDSLKLMTALQKLSEPEDIAELILFLASDKAKMITGSIYIADNGFMLKFSSC